MGKKLALVALGAVVFLVAAGAVAQFALDMDLMGLAGLGPKVPQILAPLADDLAKDDIKAYARGAALLQQALADNPRSDAVRAQAALLKLQAVVGRGASPAEVKEAQLLLDAVKRGRQPPPAFRFGQALLAVAQNRPTAVGEALGPLSAQALGREIIGYGLLSAGKAKEAAAAFEQAAAQDGARIAAVYGRGRALEEAGSAEAAAEAYGKVVTRNPHHFGALLGALRAGTLEPEERLAKLGELVEKQRAFATASELAEALVLTGRTARALHKDSEAETAFGKAIAADPGNGPANLAVAESLMAQGRFSDALGNLKSAEATPMARSVDFQFAMAGALIGSAKVAEGRKRLEEAGKRAADDARLPYWEGRAAEIGSTVDTDAAAAKYAEALKRDPKFLPASLQLAALQIREDHAPDAIATLKAAENAGAPADALQLAWGQALLAAGDPARARVAFAKALDANPKLEVARLGMAAALEQAGELEPAAEQMQKLLADAPETPGLRERLAAVLVKVGKPEEALGVFMPVIDAKKATPAMRLQAARLAGDAGKVDIGLKLVERLLDEDPRLVEAILLHARLSAAKGDLSNAMFEFKKALALDDRPQCHLEYGLVLSKTGKEDLALSEIDKGINAPGAKLERARIRYKRGDLEAALADFDAASKESPLGADSLFIVGRICDRLGRKERAASAWRDAVRLKPDLAEARYRLGVLLMDGGHPADALEHLRRATGSVPAKSEWEADLYYQLAEAERLKGSRGGATAAYKRFLELAAPDAPTRSDAERRLRELGGR